jgi:hypothetical protein
MIEDFPRILKLLKESEDITLTEFLSRVDLPENITGQLLLLSKSFSLAAPELVSVKYLARDWNALDEVQFFLEEGYKVKILYNTRVEKIEWSPEKVKAFSPGKIFEGQKVIITVPVNRVNRSPGIQIHLNERVINSLNCFGYGPTIKAIIEFREPFWKEPGFYSKIRQSPYRLDG